MKRIVSQYLRSKDSDALRDMLRDVSFSDILLYLAMEARYYSTEFKDKQYYEIAEALDGTARSLMDMSGNNDWDEREKLYQEVIKGGAMKKIIARTNEEVIEMYLRDAFPKDKMPVWGTANLKITKKPDGWSLINYATPLLYRDAAGEVWFNTSKYSVSTSTIQNKIRRIAEGLGISLTEVEEAGMPQGSW